MDIPSAVTSGQLAHDNTQDLSLFFHRARTELLTAIEKSQRRHDEYAVTVKRIWESVRSLSSQDASLSARVLEWQQSIRSALPKGEIDNQLRLAKQYLRRLNNAQKRIFDAWGLTPSELLESGSFLPSNLSQTMWRALAEISEIVTFEDAEMLLVQKMHERLKAGGHGHGWRADRRLLPQDLKAAKKDLEEKIVSEDAIKTGTPQHIDMPSIKENLEEQEYNAGDSVDSRHIATRTKRRKRNHDPNRAFDGKVVVSGPTLRSGLGAEGRRNTRNQHAHNSPVKNAQRPLEAVRYSASSATLGGREQGSGAGDYMNAAHEREDMYHTEQDYSLVDEAGENITSSIEESSVELARKGNIEADPDAFSDENSPDCFINESNSNNSDKPIDYGINEVTAREQIVSPSPAPKLTDLTDVSSYPIPYLDGIGAPLLPTGLDNTTLDPQESEGAAIPSKPTTAPLSSSSPLFMERFVGSKTLPGPDSTSKNAVVGETTAEGLSVPINPQPLETQPLPCLSQINTPENATGETTLPSTDLQGALSSFQPQCWLSSTAIELVLTLCSSNSFRVFDPLTYDIGQPKTRNIKPTPEDVQYALLPLYHREHWTLALFDVKNHTVTYFDSLPGQNIDAHKDALLKFAKDFKPGTFQLTFQYDDQAKQKNFYDCGVFVLVTSLHIFTGSVCPPLYDCCLWRAVFRALLTAQCENELPATKGENFLSTRVEDEQNDPASIKKTFLSHKQLPEEAKSGAEAANEAIDVLQKLRTMNIKLRDDTENDLPLAQSDLTIMEHVVSAYHTVRPHLQTADVTSGLQTDRSRVRAEVERLKGTLEAAKKRIDSFEAAIQTAVKTREYHAEAEAQSRQRMQRTLQDLDDLHEKQIKAAERSALVREQLGDLLR